MHVLENDAFPEAAFYPDNPNKGGDNIRKILGGPKQLWTCPSLPRRFKK